MSEGPYLPHKSIPTPPVRSLEEIMPAGAPMLQKHEKWIGVDLDGTLAWDDPGEWRGIEFIGPVIEPMLNRIKLWLHEGRTVKILTARASTPEAIPYIEAWLEAHGIGGLEITAHKDYYMDVLWDDRAVRVVRNTGSTCCDHHALRKG